MDEPYTNSPRKTRAKLFRNGRSQAVRLPKDFRFEGDEVEIHREGDRVVLEPVRKRPWPAGYWARVDREKDALEIGDVEPLGGALADVHLDE